MGRVGPLPAARLEQAPRLAGLQQLAQQPLLGAAREQARAELAQHRVVEAGVGQLQPEQVLPVDPRPHRLGGLPVGQVLAELQDGDQRQAPRRQARLAEPGEQVGEVGVGEDGAELVAQLEEGVALAEGGPGDARRLLGHGLDRAGLSDMAGLRRGGPAAGYPPTQAQPTSPTVSGRFWLIMGKSGIMVLGNARRNGCHFDRYVALNSDR